MHYDLKSPVFLTADEYEQVITSLLRTPKELVDESLDLGELVNKIRQAQSEITRT